MTPENPIGGGYMCANLHEIRYKFERLSKAINLAKKQKLSPPDLLVYLEKEIQIFEDGWKELQISTQIYADKMEQGLIRRKEFLESRNLEEQYQYFKANQTK